ncbi:hypothetical protein [Oleidesulfovibrio sp.]|uniref:hypothetical protein n=1 Tax=Oleidesulfovibrio sp. TaxID=2909707 RepID=UPI003A88671A
MRLLMAVLVAVALTGCAPKHETPLIEEHLAVYAKGPTKIIGLFATRADRRVVVVNHEGKMCAEAPPDAIDDLFTSVNKTLSAAGDAGQKVDVKVAAELSRTLMSDYQMLIDRTQGLQYFRDASFILCIMNVNGAISNEDYKLALDKVIEHSSKLISSELVTLNEDRKEYARQKAIEEEKQAQ